MMTIHGIVRAADLAEYPPGSGSIDLILGVQGVGPGHPRTLVVPFDVLLLDPALDPETVLGRAFTAEVDRVEGKRGIVASISFAPRSVLRPED